MTIINDLNRQPEAARRAQRFLDSLSAAELIVGRATEKLDHWPEGLLDFVTHLEQNNIELTVNFKSNPLPNTRNEY